VWFFLDLAKSFAKVPHERVMEKLEKRGIGGKLKRVTTHTHTLLQNHTTDVHDYHEREQLKYKKNRIKYKKLCPSVGKCL